MSGMGQDPGSPVVAVEQEEDESLQLPGFLFDPRGVVERRWRWMAAVGAIGILATVVAVVLWKPQFVAQATILITRQQIPEDFVRSTVREDTIANINAMVGEVLSRSNVARIIEKHQLFADEPEASMDSKIARVRDQVTLAPVLKATRGQSSLVYGVSFRAKKAHRSAKVANSLAALFVESSMARRNEQAKLATEFLRSELERDEAELREVSKAMSEFRRQHRGELPSELEANLRRLDMLADQRHGLIQQMTEKETRVTTMAATAGSVGTGEAVLSELRRQLAQELAANTEEHPNVASLRRQIAAQEALVASQRAGAGGANSQVGRLMSGINREIELLRQRLVETDSEIDDLRLRIDRTPAIGEELGALERREQILREDYLETLRKVEEAELAESLEMAQQGAQLSILDEARVPGGPIRPRWFVGLLGLVGSLGAAVGIGVLLELFDPVIVSAGELERLTGRPALGTLATVE